METLFARFPKSRPAISERLAAVYADSYRDNRDGKGIANALAQSLEAWMHRRVAAVRGRRILELGAGTLNHVPHEQGAGRYDIVEPFTDLFRDRLAGHRIDRVFADVGEIRGSERYDKIISVAVLEHVLDLPDCLARCGVLLQRGGTFHAGIPSEGGLLWGAAWRVSTGLAFRLRTGLDYGELMRHGHVNRADEIIALVRHFFREVSVSRFPLPVHHLSLYAHIAAQEPDLLACRRQLAGRAETADKKGRER